MYVDVLFSFVKGCVEKSAAYSDIPYIQYYRVSLTIMNAKMEAFPAASLSAKEKS